MIAHSHLHRTVSITVDRVAVCTGFLFLWFTGYSLSAFVEAVIGEYDNWLRMAIGACAALSIALVYYLITRHMKNVIRWLEDLEQRSAQVPREEIGFGTRILLWGYKTSAAAGAADTESPSPDIEHGSFIFSQPPQQRVQQQQRTTTDFDGIPAAFSAALDSNNNNKHQQSNSSVTVAVDATVKIQRMQQQQQQRQVVPEDYYTTTTTVGGRALSGHF